MSSWTSNMDVSCVYMFVYMCAQIFDSHHMTYKRGVQCDRYVKIQLGANFNRMDINIT